MTSKQKARKWLLKHIAVIFGAIGIYIGLCAVIGFWILAIDWLFANNYNIAGYIVMFGPMLFSIGFYTYIQYRDKLDEFRQLDNNYEDD